MLRVGIVAALSFITAGCVQGAGTIPTYDQRVVLAKTGVASVIRMVPSDVKTRIAWKYSLNPDCTSRGDYTLTVTSPPKHGTVAMEPSVEFPNFRWDNVRFSCNTKRVPVSAIVYTPEQGYTGDDRVQLDFASPEGILSRGLFFITVRRTGDSTPSPRETPGDSDFQ